MRLNFFSKYSKFNVDSIKKLQQIDFAFLDNRSGIGSSKFSPLLREHS